jgi:hypothetical protein
MEKGKIHRNKDLHSIRSPFNQLIHTYELALEEAAKNNKTAYVNELRISIGNLTNKIQNWEKKYYGRE